jgi:hypothetical protein
MRKIALFIAVLFFSLSTFAQTKTLPHSSTLQFVNNTRHSYDIQIDGQSKKVLPRNTFSDIKLAPGVYHCLAVQTTGYKLYPTKRRWTVEVEKDQKKVMVIE